MNGSHSPKDPPRPAVGAAEGVQVRGPEMGAARRLLTPEALEFIAALARRFEPRRSELLAQRPEFHARIAAGERPDFSAETQRIRESSWTVAPPPPELVDRRVEITGPTDRRMVLHALNSGARVYMADFEDAHSPTWAATLAGQENLADAVRGTISHVGADGNRLELVDRPAVLMVRPRGWHLSEEHLEVDGAPISASLFDAGLFLVQNARELVARGHGPYLYLPKLEHRTEAALWNSVFRDAEERLGLATGTIRATVLIETLPAVFEAEEILYELREHSAGLNSGRWDFIFSFIKQFRDDPSVLFPDRVQLRMETPFLSAYAAHLVRICHRRGAHAIGGMAAEVPIKNDPAANERALAAVVADKEREVALGYDGTWVAHPALVPVAQRAFDAQMPGPNQIARQPRPPAVRAAELLRVPSGTVTYGGVRTNARAAVRYLESWLRGVGCVPIDHRMEDAATVEIARAQLWQWIRRAAPLAAGGSVRREEVERVIDDEARVLASEAGGASRTLAPAVALLKELIDPTAFQEYFTTRAYILLNAGDGGPS
ncbi:MAG: malate synthase A [Thermoplasmata archaeon]